MNLQLVRVWTEVVAQVVEQQHSVRAGWVQNSGWTFAFLVQFGLVNLFSLSIGLLLTMTNIHFTSSFLFAIIIYLCKYLTIEIYCCTTKGAIKSLKSLGKGRIKKNLIGFKAPYNSTTNSSQYLGHF